jgi:signal transduction histidine kinase
MSHELRTPLNAIIGVSEMLREDAEALKQDTEPLDRVLSIALRHITLIMCRVFDLRLLRGPSQLKPWNHLVRINEMLT